MCEIVVMVLSVLLDATGRRRSEGRKSTSNYRCSAVGAIRALWLKKERKYKGPK